MDELIGTMGRMASAGIPGLIGSGVVLILFIVGQLLAKRYADQVAKAQQAQRQEQDQAANPTQNAKSDQDAAKAKDEVDKIISGGP